MNNLLFADFQNNLNENIVENFVQFQIQFLIVLKKNLSILKKIILTKVKNIILKIVENKDPISWRMTMVGDFIVRPNQSYVKCLKVARPVFELRSNQGHV